MSQVREFSPVPADGEGDALQKQNYPMATMGERDGEPFFGLLSLRTKLLYAFPMLGYFALRFMKTAYMKKFYTDDYPRASLSTVATCLAIATLIDIFWDPFVAAWTDGTRLCCGRDRGRRKPFLFCSGFILVISFVLAYVPPADFSSAEQAKFMAWNATATEEMRAEGSPVFASFRSAMWFGVFHIMISVISYSLRDIPYGALGAELTSDTKERTSLWAHWEVWGMVGILLGMVSPAVVPMGGADCSSSPETGCTKYLIFALAFGVIFLVANLLVCKLMRERPSDSLPEESTPLVPTMIQCLTNRPFSMLIISDCIEGVGGNLPMAVMPYVTTWVIGKKACLEWGLEPDMLFAYMVIVHILVRIPTTWAWKYAADRFGKLNVFIVFNAVFAAQHMCFLYIDEGRVIAAFILCFTWGIAYAGHWLLKDITSDVLDYDELVSGQRREGQYMMILDLIPKILEVPSEALPFMLMSHYGYSPDLDEQSSEVKWLLRLSFSVVPGFFGLLSMFVLLKFPLRTAEQHQLILQGIEAHKEGRAALDPLTGKELPPVQTLEDGSVRFGFETIERDDIEILQNFFPSEIKRASDAEDISALQTWPLIGVVLSLLFAVPGAWIVQADWAKMVAGHHSWVAVGIILVGFCGISFWFSLTRLCKAREAVASGISVKVLNSLVRLYIAQGLIVYHDDDDESASTTDEE